MTFISRSITTDELNPLAKVFGVKGIEHDSMGHVLNTRAMGIAVAKDLGRHFEECNFIIVHVGGGNSVSLWSKGQLIDTFPTDYGTFSAERCGCMRMGQVVSLCEKYGLDTVKSWLSGKGGMVSLVGTNELKKVEELIQSGDKYALLCEQAMAYQLSKLIAALVPVVHGELDAIIITGGGASNLDTPPLRYSQDIVDRNDKSEPVPHLEDSVRIIMRCVARPLSNP